MLVPINLIKANPKNPRVIKDHKFEKLKLSIESFPQMLDKRPLVVFTDTDGKYVILGGNMRFKAAKELGFKELPVIIADDWTEEQKTQFLIKDNVSTGDWDWDILANEWDEDLLFELGIDIPNIEPIGDIEAKGRMNASLDEKLDTYLNATIKQIVLYYEMEEYEYILKELDKIAEKNNLKDNSDTIKFLIENHG